MERLIHQQLEDISRRKEIIKALEAEKTALLNSALQTQLHINKETQELYIVENEVYTLHEKFPANEATDGQSSVYQNLNQRPFTQDYQQ